MELATATDAYRLKLIREVGHLKLRRRSSCIISIRLPALESLMSVSKKA